MHDAKVICLPRPLGPGNSGAFKIFSIFKAALKTLHYGAKFVVKFLLEAPSPGVDNNATDICIHHDVLLQANLALGPEQFGQKLDRFSFRTNYSGPRVGFQSLSHKNTYEGYF